jgi:hypothetical protein
MRACITLLAIFASSAFGQNTFTGKLAGAGTLNCGGNLGVRGWNGSGVLTVTLSPAPSSIQLPAGGSFSGSWSASGDADGCGTTIPVMAGGSASGSIDGFGGLQIRLDGGGCTLSGVGDASSFGGSAPASCIDSRLSGSLQFFASSGASVPPNTKGPSGTPTNPTGIFADPVNSATGNYYSTFTDMDVRGRGLSFIFNRYYNSFGNAAGPFGANWSHSFNISLSADIVTGSVQIKQASGGVLSFLPSGGTYSPVTAGSFDSLTRNGDGTFVLEYPIGLS